MRRIVVISALAVALGACATAPPEREPLPDVGNVLDPPVACSFLVGDPLGVEVTEVLEGTAADGVLEPDDVLTAVGGTPTPDSDQLRLALDEHEVGDEVGIDLIRDGSEQTVQLTLGANPDDPEQVFIGVMIHTAYEMLPAAEAAQEVPSSATSRSLTIGGTLFAGDPTLGVWSNTGIALDEQTNWVTTERSTYSLVGEGDRVLTDVVTGEIVDYELGGEWSAARLIGSIEEDLLIAVTQPVEDDPELVLVGIARFDPITGETEWTGGVSEGFGLPVSAWSAPEADFIAIAGLESGELSGADILNADGSTAGFEDITPLGSPVGWLDEERALFRTTPASATSVNVVTGERTELTLDPSFDTVPVTPIFAVADGRSILGISGRALILDDLEASGEVRVLAENCSFQRIGESGWVP